MLAYDKLHQGFLDRKDPDNVTLEALMRNDVLAVLCCPLAQDPAAGVQALSLSCLAKLAKSDPLLSQVVVSCGVLDSVVTSLSHQSPPVQAAADSVLSAVAKSTTDFAHRIMVAGALSPLLAQLHSAQTPVDVKESAVRTLDSLIQSSVEHATIICNDELLSTLVALMLSPDSSHSLTRAIVSAIGHAAALSGALSEAAVAQNVLEPLQRLVRGNLTAGPTPPDLKAGALNALGHLSSHHEGLANQVAATGVVQPSVQSMTDKLTPAIRRNAASLVLQLVEKTPALAQQVLSCGIPSCLKQYMQQEKGNAQGALVGIMIAGSMASYTSALAKALVDAGAYGEVVNCIKNQDPSVSGAAAWAVEQAASHGEDLTMLLLDRHRALQELMDTYGRVPKSQTERKAKLKSAIKAAVRNCNQTGALESFVDPYGPPELSKHVLARLFPLLEKNPKSRQQLVTSGALQRLQEAMAELDPVGAKHAEAINSLFPEDVVEYYQQGIKKPAAGRR